MCECCGPTNGDREHLSPELTGKFRELNQQSADERGISLEEFLEGNLPTKPRGAVADWFRGIWRTIMLHTGRS